MEQAYQTYLQFLCHSLAKATSAAVRIYLDRVCVYDYSVYHLQPDPANLYLTQLLDDSHTAGVFTTPLYQFYGFLNAKNGFRIVVGPSRIENADPRLTEEQLFTLGIRQQDRENYLHMLSCVPVISAERMGWLVTFLATAVEQAVFPMEKLYVNIKPEDHRTAVQTSYVRAREAGSWQPDTQQMLDQGYRFEKLILSYIQQGETERIREILNSPPRMLAGKMSDDTLRQMKNTGICAATVCSRAAIAGGLDSRTAFRMSDLYIQKIELLRDAASLEKLRNDIFLDYAEAVRRIRYRVAPAGDGPKDLFEACAEYVTQNIYNPIRAEEMAQALGYTRSYLSGRFKQQTGMTLTQYILQEKVFEAKRMLEFTDESLADIAALFSFSSQSHFQNVFKKVTGMTPLAYRKRVR